MVTDYDRIKIRERCPEFKNLEILDTWFEDLFQLEEEIKEKQRYLRLVKKERKLQPTVNTQSILTNEKRVMNPGYKIIVGDKDKILFVVD